MYAKMLLACMCASDLTLLITHYVCFQTIGKKGPNDDVSSLDLFVTFDDFVEMFCRLVVSDLWMFAPEQDESASNRTGSAKTMAPSESNPTLQRQGSSRSPIVIIEAALSKRLNEWLKLI